MSAPDHVSLTIPAGARRAFRAIAPRRRFLTDDPVGNRIEFLER